MVWTLSHNVVTMETSAIAMMANVIDYILIPLDLWTMEAVCIRIVYGKLPPIQSVIRLLGGKPKQLLHGMVLLGLCLETLFPKWLPLNFGFNDVMRMVRFGHACTLCIETLTWFLHIQRYQNGINGARAHFVMVPKLKWKPFWLAAQLYPQNNSTWWQNRVNYDVLVRAPSNWKCRRREILWCLQRVRGGMECTTLAKKIKLRQPRKPNIGACMLERSRTCATCARLSQFFWPG